MSDNRIVREIERGERTLAGIDVRVTELVWSDGGRSFDVYRVDDGTDLTEAESFDTYPTDAQIANLLRSTGALWVCHCGTPYDASDADMIVQHVRGCDFVDGAGQPINQAEALGYKDELRRLSNRKFLDETAVAAATLAGDMVELNWSIEVTEEWRRKVSVGDLVDAINAGLDEDYDEDTTPVDAEGVRSAVRTNTFVRLFGDVLARDGGTLPDWEDTEMEGVTVSANVTERGLDGATFAEEVGDGGTS